MAILVSFLWGTLSFPEENRVNSYAGVVLALALLLAGVFAIAFCEQIGARLSGGGGGGRAPPGARDGGEGGSLLAGEQNAEAGLAPGASSGEAARGPSALAAMALAYEEPTRAAFYKVRNTPC